MNPAVVMCVEEQNGKAAEADEDSRASGRRCERRQGLANGA